MRRAKTQVLSLRCSSQHLLARCRSQCSYTQYGKICISQVKLSYSLCNQHATLTSLMHLNRALAHGVIPCLVFFWMNVEWSAGILLFDLLQNTYTIDLKRRCILVKQNFIKL
ncbi:hypothetical protein CHARACLAT_032678 [Characodon lateralis]|uniref:Uncharacterized protein n=1 Tax=Characodon lateralis TaxID=208331 RepID=A0ABU7CT74_9TELE|nr:hypothetical protein [Characodon lateralis]